MTKQWRAYVGAVLAALFALPVIATPAVAVSGSAPAASEPIAGHQFTTAPVVSQAESDSPLDVTITSVGDAVLEPGQDLTVSVEITNSSTTAVSLASLELRSGTVLTRTTGLESWMSGVSASGWLMTSQPSDILDPSASRTYSLVLDSAVMPWPTGRFEWGPRGIEVIATTASGEASSDRSVIVVGTAAELPRTATTAIVPLTRAEDSIVNAPTAAQVVATYAATGAPLGPDAVVPIAPTEADFARINAVSQLGEGYAVLVDSSLAAALPESLQSSLAGSLPYYDADLSALARLGETARAEQVSTNVGAPLVYDDAHDTSTIDFLAELGYNAVVIDDINASTDTSAFEPAAFVPAVASGLALDAYRTNSALSDAVAGELAGEPLDTLDSRQVALAISAIQYRERPSDQRGVVFEIGRQLSQGALANASAVLGAPWVEATGLDAQRELPYVGELRMNEKSEPNFGELSDTILDQIDEALTQARIVQSILPDPGLLPTLLIDRELLTLSRAYRLYPAARMTQISGLNSAGGDGEVYVRPSSTINMISETSALPLQVENTYAFDVSVVVHLDTPDSRLRATQTVQIDIPADTTKSVSMPVQAWGSGNLTVSSWVTNVDGVSLGPDQEINVRVRASWESTGTIVIAVAVLALFLFGVVKSVRAGRRAEPASPSDPPPPSAVGEE